MAGRNVDFVSTIPGRCALSVNDADMPAPRGWAWTPLSEVARLESGHTPSRSHPEYWDGDIPWIGIRDAREHHGGTIVETSQRVTQAGIDNSAARILPANTVCLSRTASVGYVVTMGRPMATSQDFVNWVCSPALEPEFLKWILLAEGQEGLRKFGKGSTHTTIYFPEVQAFHACIAPVNEQRRIVAKLDAIFEQTRAAKARFERLPALLEKLKRSILAAAFRGDLTADWRAANPNVEPASVLAARIRLQRDDRTSLPNDTAFSSQLSDAELPETWFVALTANIGQVQLGRQLSAGKYTGALHPYVRVANVADDRLSFDDLKEMEFSSQELAQYLLRPGDIVLSEGQTLERLGQSAMYKSGDPPVCFQKTLNRFRATEAGPLPEYAQLYFRFCMHTGVFRAAGSITTNIGHLTQEKLRRIPFILCPLEEQLLLVNRARGALAQLERLKERTAAALAELAALEQAALAKAFRGELVQQDPSDEPATVLLQRIRAARAAEPVRPRGRAAPTRPESGLRQPVNGHAITPTSDDSVDLVVAAFQAEPRLTVAAITTATGLDPTLVKEALKTLVESGQVRVHPRSRGTTYEWTA